MALLKFHTNGTVDRPPDERGALEFGQTGEQIAARYLVDKGFSILEKNYRRGHLEIDLVALDGDELVVVEVKSRASDTLLPPEGAVDHRKRTALIRLANEYVRSHDRKESVRFDIVSVVSSPEGVEIKHIENAYNVMSF